MIRLLASLSSIVCLATSARGDDFVDVLSRNVWVRKGGLACDSASTAADGGSGLFSRCAPLPYALRVELVTDAEPTAKVYYMRVIGVGDRPLTAWFDRDSLTNHPAPGDIGPVP